MILISAGHHPKSPGACHDGFCEHDEAVRWVIELLQHFDETEAAAVPTGTLAEKTDYINKRQPKLAVEIHFNSLYANKTVDAERGCLQLYYPGSETGKRAAQIVQDALAPLFPPDLGVREGFYRLDPTMGVDWFLAKTNCMALILEPEFIDRKDEIVTKRAQACLALAEALKTIVKEAV